MAALGRLVSSVAINVTSFSLKQVCSACQGLLKVNPIGQQVPVRTRFVDWRMVKDAKRRRMVTEAAPERLRINSLRKNTILPRELQEIATQELSAFPRDTNHTRLVRRCILTSRPRGVLRRYRISRIMWRHLADYNKLSGVTRAIW